MTQPTLPLSAEWFERVRELTVQMVRWPSLTSSAGETQFAQHLHHLLSQWPYFQAHPEHLHLERTTHDVVERYSVFALVRGTANVDAPSPTAVLCGHYDVVSIDNFGELADVAFDPEALLPRLIADLERDARSSAAQRALHDLQSGDYLPGRGSLDMKSGLAAGLAVLERWATQPSPPANVLFIAVPDEEDTSQGMRSAVQALPKLAQRWNLSLTAAINLDAGVNLSRDDDGRAAFLGSVGKLLPSVFFVGVPTHAGAPFDGVNAALMAAELTRLVEANPEAGDLSDGDPAAEMAPPPVTLYQTDRRTRYDVTTPATAWCAFNLLTHRRSPQAVLNTFVTLTQAAIASALDLMQTRGDRYALGLGLPRLPRHWQPQVLTYAELVAQVPQNRVQQIQHMLSSNTQLDNIAYSQELIASLVREANLSGPAAVVCLASVYYPLVQLNASPRDAALRAAVTNVAGELSAACGYEVGVRPFFSGISDMSFVAGRDDAEGLRAVQDNTPIWGSRLTFDYGAASQLNLPIVNIGPWGHDYHQRTERVHMPYSFGVVPEFIWQVVGSVAGG